MAMKDNLTTIEIKRGLANNVAGTLLCALVFALGVKWWDTSLLSLGSVGGLLGLFSIAVSWNALKRKKDEDRSSSQGPTGPS